MALLKWSFRESTEVIFSFRILQNKINISKAVNLPQYIHQFWQAQPPGSPENCIKLNHVSYHGPTVPWVS